MAASNPQPPTAPFTLGDCRVNPAANTITGPAGKTTIEPKVMAVLLLLASKPGDVITRDEFLDTIWSREYGGDESLTRAVSLLRKALGDGRGARSLIQTVPRRGYRLLVEPGAARPVDRLVADTPERRPRWMPLGLAVLTVLVALLAVDRFGRRPVEPPAPGDQKTRPVIAVLPFDTQTPVEEDRYLAEGLADEIIAALARNDSVSVIAGNSSFRFRGEAKKDLARIVDQLEATHVVDGAVRRSPSGLRVSVHLVEAGNGLTTWSDVFERAAGGVYEMPDEVALSIVESLDPLAANGQVQAEDNGIPSGRSPDPDAYRLYLQAQALLREATVASLHSAVGYFEQAVQLDPDLAEAWSALALARLYVMLVEPGQDAAGFRNRDPEERLAAARNEARRALAIDPDSVEARLAQVIIDYRARLLPLAEAERGFRGVAESAPHNPEVNMRMGMMMQELGRFEDASVYFGRAVRLDPLSIQAGGFYIQALQHSGRGEAARQFIDSGRCPWYPSSFTRLEQLLVEDDFDGARGWLELVGRHAYFQPHRAVGQSRERNLAGDPLYRLLERLVQLAESGEPDNDPGLADELISAADEGRLLHFYAAVLLAAAGVVDPVFDLVHQRLAVDDLYFRAILFRDALGGLRSDPRVMAWFDASTHLDHWLDGGAWPDFCSDPALPYNCADAARAYRVEKTAP